MSDIEPTWLDRQALLDTHAKAAPGVKFLNEGSFDAALVAPINAWWYRKCNNVFDLAALYCAKLARGHAFTDGNKRLAWIACQMFLLDNGVEVVADARDADRIVRGVADGSVTDRVFADWLRGKVNPAPQAL